MRIQRYSDGASKQTIIAKIVAVSGNTTGADGSNCFQRLGGFLVPGALDEELLLP